MNLKLSVPLSLSAHDTRVYQYEFQHRTSLFSMRPSYTKAAHGDELFYMFGIPLLRDDTGASWKYSFTQEERDLSLDMMAYWVNFATNGCVELWSLMLVGTSQVAKIKTRCFENVSQ